jgi:tetratricopeptide (TPR) repeat protein
VDADEAIQHNPKLPLAYSVRGFAHGKKGDFERAMADLNKAIELNSRIPSGYIHRGLIYEARGEFKPALADFRMALSLNSKEFSARKEAADGVKRVEQKLVPERRTP